MVVVQFKDVWEMYRIKFVIAGKSRPENFWALKGINFEVQKGEVLGIIGENGAGKSTILKLIAGVLKPDRGEVSVSGRVAGLLELGAGFQPELTGMENIRLVAALFGLKASQIQDKYDDIIHFASLGKFIHAPVKCYSQGMFVRLAFAIAVHVDPDIFLIDDTLAVGDEYFQRKCLKKIFEIKNQAKTIIFVSHDMAMLSRLCLRALFLKEGRIIEDNLVDKVLPLYTQMVGTQEGVGVLSKGPLTLVFNNGRFFLNWRGQLLTPGSGAHTVFSSKNKWHSSLAADWRVEKTSDNKLVATGQFYPLALTQVWRLELNDDNTVRWDVEMALREPCEIQEGYVQMMVTDRYTQWFTSLEKGEFPAIREDNKIWQALLENNIFRKCVGVMSVDNAAQKLPSLAFEQSQDLARNLVQIFNTDYLAASRVLQYKIGGLQSSPLGQTDRFIYFSGKVVLDIPNLDNYLKDSQEDFALGKGPLRLTFDHGRGILSWKGVDLTKANHMGTSLLVNGRWHSSPSALWEFKKEKKNKLIARGVWHNLPIAQIWKIELKDESSFLWEVDLEIKDKVSIEEQHLWFMLLESYTKWFCEYGKGSFPDEFLEDRMDMFQRCIPDGSMGLQSPNADFPAISLNFSKELNNFAKIFNSDFYNKARILEVEKVQPETHITFLPGEHRCFKIEAHLVKDVPLGPILEGWENRLQNEKLKFIFDKGRGRIYWGDIELTKRLGLYTSVRSHGRWYDSASSALWKIEEKTQDAMKAVGKWLYLPICQYWEMRIKEKNLIEFIVKLIIYEETEVDRLQTNLMLLERYSSWFHDKERGSFPVFKENVDDNWDCLCSEEGTGSIGVFPPADHRVLPSVKLCPYPLNSGGRLYIANSDIYHRGRILQYLNTSQILFPAGEYPYFNGKIVIDS